MTPQTITSPDAIADARNEECEAFGGGCAFDRLDRSVQEALVEHYLNAGRHWSTRIPPPSNHARRRLPPARYGLPVAPRLPAFNRR